MVEPTRHQESLIKLWKEQAEHATFSNYILAAACSILVHLHIVPWFNACLLGFLCWRAMSEDADCRKLRELQSNFDVEEYRKFELRYNMENGVEAWRNLNNSWIMNVQKIRVYW